MRLTKSSIPLGPYILPRWCYSLRVSGPLGDTVTVRVYPWARVVLFAQVAWRWATGQELEG